VEEIPYTMGKIPHILLNRIERNYNSKITGWGSIDKLLYDINLLTIRLLALRLSGIVVAVCNGKGETDYADL
jgi:hypothetical protein